MHMHRKVKEEMRGRAGCESKGARYVQMLRTQRGSRTPRWRGRVLHVCGLVDDVFVYWVVDGHRPGHADYGHVAKREPSVNGGLDLIPEDLRMAAGQPESFAAQYFLEFFIEYSLGVQFGIAGAQNRGAMSQGDDCPVLEVDAQQVSVRQHMVLALQARMLTQLVFRDTSQHLLGERVYERHSPCKHQAETMVRTNDC